MDTLKTPTLAQGERFYSPRQIYLASFLGSPLAAAWFFSRNYLAVADRSRARRSLWLGLGASAVVLLVAFLLPPKFPNVLWPLTYSAVVYLYASSCFAAVYENYITRGGVKGSWWAVIGTSLGTCVVLIALAVAAFTLFAWCTGAQIDWDPRH
jgi:hypothetical protein